MRFAPPDGNAVGPATMAHKVLVVGPAYSEAKRAMHHWLKEQYAGQALHTTPVKYTTVTFADGKELTLAIWDTAGEMKYADVASMQSRGAKAAIVLYDPTDRSSFDDVPARCQMVVQRAVGCCLCIVSVNPSDAGDGVVSKEEVEALVTKNNARAFEVSGKTGAGLDAVMEHVAERVALLVAETEQRQHPQQTKRTRACWCFRTPRVEVRRALV